MSTVEVRVDRVLGGGPFCEIGRPRVTATTPDGTLTAIGGALTTPQWHARDVSRRSSPDPGWHPTAVYRSTDLTCLFHLTTRWPANTLAFHPTLPLLAIGTGRYDGGWAYEGELLLLDLVTGVTVSLLQHPREVRRLTWQDPQTLDLVLAVPCDEDTKRFGTTSLACAIRRDDWDRATDGMLRMPYGEEPYPDECPTDPADATAVLEQRLGRAWTPRRAVWAVRGLPDGCVLAALDGIAVECWTPTSPDHAWRVPSDGTGYQVTTLPSERTALTLTQTTHSYGRWTTQPSAVVEVDLDTGAVRTIHRAAAPSVMVSRADGRWALRVTEAKAGRVTIAGLAGARGRKVQLGPYRLFNHYFDIRYAPDLLFLQDDADTRWVVAVDTPHRRVRRLFPLEWDTSRGGHLSGGCGAYLDDRAGPAIVHAGTVHNGAGLLPGNAFVVRRAYPTGEPSWVFTADHQATALDVDGDFIYVTFTSGELVVLRATDGAVQGRQQLRVNGHRVVPFSLARTGANLLAIGTQDGRVLDCSIHRLIH
ncbi:hypothetical protein [Actinoplanes derwentensis]|uniref:Uncharacterized protein n=1 Tax=Actinoplanes derwentensis TaxID=113562 RepID=A0A1H1WBE3_9ACTN|nr:hypothetical protein [Actinoplanes derwentensis]GID84118.1 hypothetical protein Ade03nite_30420 [Actinoplanes derwentensis]SDS94404.1 hypothetical protein SAMN04489716_2049 [Actinoplanes derwentensis]